MKVSDLQSFDTLVSYKAPPEGYWPPDKIIKRYMDNQLIKYNEKWYPGGDNKWNHVRGYIGNLVPVPGGSKIKKYPLIAESTFPFTQVAPLEDWMLDPAYCHIYRMTEPLVNVAGAYAKVFSLLGKVYDIGQLLAMHTGWRKFDWGKSNTVCSTFWRIILEVATGKSFGEHPKVNETPPAFYTNNPDLFVKIN